MSALTFHYTFPYSNDEVYFAYCIPYTYSDMLQHLRLIKNSQVLQQTRLTFSFGGLDIPLLSITDFQDTADMDTRKVILVNSRIHPGETVGSWKCQGFINFLLSPHPDAFALRRKVIFKIVPMLNVDGVVAGNYRTGLQGKDLNRVFGVKNQSMYPEVQALMNLAHDLKKKHGSNFFGFYDFHGHSSKSNVFSYGPSFKQDDLHYYLSQFLPKMLESSTKMFRFSSCTFTVSEYKKMAGRAYVFSVL